MQKYIVLKMNELKIKELREKLGLTQEKLAELIGVSRNTIINYEKGGKIPESKRQILNNILLKNAQYETVVNEPSSVYLTGYDKKVNEAKQEIEELEKKLKSNDPDLSEKAKEFIRNIISLKYEEINLILEAKLDKLKEDEELNN